MLFQEKRMLNFQSKPCGFGGRLLLPEKMGALEDIQSIRK